MVIPKGIPPEVVSLDLSMNELQGIQSWDLQGLDNLAFLNLSQNSLWGDAIKQGALDLPNLISVDFFDKLPNLDKVAISYTPITNSGIPDDIFVNNTKLTSLSLRSTDLAIPLLSLPSSLQMLDYVGNNIQKLQAYAFQNLQNLQVLQLTENPITTIEDNAFEGLNKLMILDIMECNFSSVITRDTFSGLRGLQSLYFSNNLIPNIAVGALHDFQNLESLWLSGNKLRTMDEDVLDPKNIPQMIRLAIDSNPWFCDCHLKWLREKADNASYTVMYLKDIRCDGPPNVAGKTWDDLKPEDFVC
ncbi:hypothetical protein FSP39_018552 [Pinctada imbricata]|uniref:LRRCT domain-containing protein n=1 Tax=Pinctada imbricata TaxID=66713 RepID=A0AA88YAC3_PINIB|nr:hypothetical protein FSP39_018552 [Pinctada imbricata]